MQTAHFMARMDLTDEQLLANLRTALAVDDEPTACGWLHRLAGRQPRNAGVGLLAVVAALRGEGTGSASDEWWCGFCGQTHRSLACPTRVIPPALTDDDPQLGPILRTMRSRVTPPEEGTGA